MSRNTPTLRKNLAVHFNRSSRLFTVEHFDLVSSKREREAGNSGASTAKAMRLQ